MSIPSAAARLHDPDLLDRLADVTPQSFKGIAWRATRVNHDPLAFSFNGGRWAPPSSYQSIPVLYTSLERDGAIAEMTSWLALLVPRPSKPIMIHRLEVEAADVISLDVPALAELGIDMSGYQDRSMDQLPLSRSQQIGAALAFLGIDGLIVPSARWSCSNLVLFDNFDNQIRVHHLDSGEVDWIRSLGQNQ